MTPVLVTLNDLEGHLPVADLFKCSLSNICAAFYHISTDSMLAHADSWASYIESHDSVKNILLVRNQLNILWRLLM